MEFTQEAIENERIKLNFDHPGFNEPLQYRWIKKSDFPQMVGIFRNNSDHLKGYIEWAKYSKNWSYMHIQELVTSLANPEFPWINLVFLLGKRIVGVGSLAPMHQIDEIQISLFVVDGYQGHGIGTRIAKTLEIYAFEVFGYSRLYYQCDATNESSKKLPVKLGYNYSHSFDAEISAELESGFWLSFVKHRPTDLPPALFQGGDIEQYEQVRHKL